jgi:predicted ester cyclase
MATPEENKATVLRFYAPIDSDRHDEAFELLTPDFVANMPGGWGPVECDAFRRTIKGQYLYAALPDGRHTFTQVITEGDRVVSRGTFRGTHLGELWGIPHTGKQIAFAAMHLDRLAGSKLVEHHGLSDRLACCSNSAPFPRLASPDKEPSALGMMLQPLLIIHKTNGANFLMLV